MPDIIYTRVSSNHTVKPTQTEFINNTDKAITWCYESGSDLCLQAGETSDKISKKIQSINYNAKFYYIQDAEAAKLEDGKIPPNTVATIEFDDSNLVMRIP